MPNTQTHLGSISPRLFPLPELSLTPLPSGGGGGGRRRSREPSRERSRGASPFRRRSAGSVSGGPAGFRGSGCRKASRYTRHISCIWRHRCPSVHSGENPSIVHSDENGVAVLGGRPHRPRFLRHETLRVIPCRRNGVCCWCHRGAQRSPRRGQRRVPRVGAGVDEARVHRARIGRPALGLRRWQGWMRGAGGPRAAHRPLRGHLLDNWHFSVREDRASRLPPALQGPGPVLSG